MKKFLSIALCGASLICCALFNAVPMASATAPPGINIAALDYKFGLLEVSEKRPWLNPARAALRI